MSGHGSVSGAGSNPVALGVRVLLPALHRQGRSVGEGCLTARPPRLRWSYLQRPAKCPPAGALDASPALPSSRRAGQGTTLQGPSCWLLDPGFPQRLVRSSGQQDDPCRRPQATTVAPASEEDAGRRYERGYAPHAAAPGSSYFVGDRVYVADGNPSRAVPTAQPLACQGVSRRPDPITHSSDIEHVHSGGVDRRPVRVHVLGAQRTDPLNEEEAPEPLPRPGAS